MATVLNLVNPVMNERISWPWFVACQLGFGLVGGFVIARSTSIRTMQSWSLAERAFVEAPGMHAARRRARMMLRPSRLRARLKAYALLTLASVFSAAATLPVSLPQTPKKQKKERHGFQRLFARNCSGCHGAEGKNGPGRILNDALYLAVIPKEEIRKDRSLMDAPERPCLAWSRADGGALTDKQIDILVDGIEKNWSKPAPACNSAFAALQRSGRERGCESGQTAVCAVLCALPPARRHRPGVRPELSQPGDQSEHTDFHHRGAA